MPPPPRGGRPPPMQPWPRVLPRRCRRARHHQQGDQQGQCEGRYPSSPHRITCAFPFRSVLRSSRGGIRVGGSITSLIPLPSPPPLPPKLPETSSLLRSRPRSRCLPSPRCHRSPSRPEDEPLLQEPLLGPPEPLHRGAATRPAAAVRIVPTSSKPEPLQLAAGGPAASRASGARVTSELPSPPAARAAAASAAATASEPLAPAPMPAVHASASGASARGSSPLSRSPTFVQYPCRLRERRPTVAPTARMGACQAWPRAPRLGRCARSVLASFTATAAHHERLAAAAAMADLRCPCGADLGEQSRRRRPAAVETSGIGTCGPAHAAQSGAGATARRHRCASGGTTWSAAGTLSGMSTSARLAGAASIAATSLAKAALNEARARCTSTSAVGRETSITSAISVAVEAVQVLEHEGRAVAFVRRPGDGLDQRHRLGLLVARRR